MSILTLEFLGFAAALVLVYYLAPLRARPLVLLAASGAFVACAGWQSAAHLAAAALLTWGGALGLAALRQRPRLRGCLLAVLLTLLLGTMAFIKYEDVLSSLLKADLWRLAAPLGLSYFTFQSAGYLIDVSRGKAQAAKNPLRALLFVGYFAQLPQGPISAWKELEPQLSTGHRLEPENLAAGFQLMAWGYFKKLVIADRLLPTTDALLSGEALPGWFVLGGVALYALRLYADFSGGMDVVRGLSRMLGVTLPENFRRPFFARSVAEYWRRWHITLGAWFRAYLLYPLSASRAGVGLSRLAGRAIGKKAGRTLPSALATLLVFLLIGVWHMASWNAVAYGGYFGLVMAASMLLEPVWKTMQRTLRLPKKGWMTPLRILRTILLILPAQYFAFTAGPEQGFSLLRQTFAGWNFTGFGERLTAVMPALEWIIAAAAALVLLAVDLLCEHVKDFGGRLARGTVLIRWPLLILLIAAVLVFGCYGTGYDAAAFLYTQF